MPQYTIRNVPEALDRSLRERALKQGLSLNETLVSALMRGAGIEGEAKEQHDLDDLAGTWICDAAFDEAIASHDVIDEALWR